MGLYTAELGFDPRRGYQYYSGGYPNQSHIWRNGTGEVKTGYFYNSSSAPFRLNAQGVFKTRSF